MIRKYPGVFLLGFAVVGILLADQTGLAGRLFLAVALVGCLSGIALALARCPRAAAVLFACSLGMAAGCHFAARYQSRGPGHVLNRSELGCRYRFFGSVCDWPSLKSSGTAIPVRLDSLRASTTLPVSGRVLLRLAVRTTRFGRGDYLEFEGRLEPIRNSESISGFDRGRYYQLRGLSAIVYATVASDVRLHRRSAAWYMVLIDRLRDDIRSCLQRSLSPQGAALAAGYLIGETRDIPPRVYRLFRNSGTLHLLAVSGSNVALILLFVLVFLRPFRLGRGRRAALLGTVLVAFLLLSYAEPSVLRASIMAALVLLVGLVERRYNLNHIIALAALAALLWNPAQLFHVGFQLSFATAWGLVFLTPRIINLWQSHRQPWWSRYLLFPLLISAVAQACSGPIIAYHFHQLPVLTVPANLIIVPLVSIGVVGVLVLLVAELVWPGLGLLVGSALDMVLNVTVSLLEFLGGAHAPVVSFTDFPWWWAVLFLGWLALASLALSNRRVLRLVIITSLVIVNALLLVGVSTPLRQSWDHRLTLASVPGGIVAIVRTRGRPGADAIVTGLAAGDYDFDEYVGRPLLSRLGVGRLDRLFVLSSDFDAVTDLLRWSQVSHAGAIYIHPSLQATFTDAIRLYDAEVGAPQIIPWSPCRNQSLPEGYQLRPDGLWLKLDSVMCCFCDMVGSPKVQSPADSRRTILITGTHLTHARHGRLSQSFDRIVCSSSEQRGQSPTDSLGDSSPVCDLRETGPVHIDFQPDLGALPEVETGI